MLEPNNTTLSPRMVRTSLTQLFVSYSWRSDRDGQVSKLIDDLAGYYGFGVEKSAGHNDASVMADGIDMASVVLVVVSDSYKDNSSCRSEASYAHDQGKHFVGIKFDKNCRVDGWLQAIFGTSTVVIDMSSPSSATTTATATAARQQMCDRLVGEIQKKARLAQEFAEQAPVEVHPILEAAKLGDVAQIRAIIASEGDHLLDQHHGDAIGDMPIHRAARYGRTEAIQCLIELGANAQLRNKLGATPLHLASLMGNTGTVRYLVREAGADVNARDSMNWLPIHLASAGGHAEVVEILLDQDPANVEAKTGEEDFESTPLMEAARNGKVEVAKVLLARGADRTAKNTRDNNALHLAAINDYPDMAEFLIEEAGLKLEERGQYGRTPLLTSCAHASVQVTHYLLQKGADLFAHSEAESDNDSLPVHLAAAAGSAEILETIFSYVFEPKDFQQRTPLQRAAINGEYSSAAFLASHGTRRVFGEKDVHGKTALMLAQEAEKRDRNQASDIVRLLRDYTTSNSSSSK